MWDENLRLAEKVRLEAEQNHFSDIVNEVNKIDVRKKQEKEDSKSMNSGRSRGSRRSRLSAQPRVTLTDDGDDESVAGVSIQYPQDFDYDDDAIRQVI